MGRDKVENEELIKYGHPEDVWFHVDDMSSAHVYLRMNPNMTLDDISNELLIDCASLVKANSIQGCKKNTVYVVYTLWSNLKKTNDMVDGQVGFHQPEFVKRLEIEKNNSIVNALNKSKIVANKTSHDLYEEQKQRHVEIQAQLKKQRQEEDKTQKLMELQRKKDMEERSYKNIMKVDKMKSNTQREATVDTSAAQAYEEDFF